MKKVLIILLTALTLFAGCDLDTINSEFDLTALDAKIAEAHSVTEGVQVAANASEVAQGRKWVENDDMSAIQAAILVAEATRALATSQSKVDDAVTTLDTAIAVFLVKIKYGTKASGFTEQELTALITEAETAKEGVRTSADGANVSPQEYWVTSAIMTALTNAINTANTGGGSIDSRYTSLVTALNNFYNGKHQGTAAVSRSITITNLLGFSNGSEIYVGLFANNNLSVGVNPQIVGSGRINNNKATIVLYNNSDNNNVLWTGNGSYYAGFQSGIKIYISKSQITFSDSASNPSVSYSNFEQYIFEYNFGEIAYATGFPIPSGGITLDNFCLSMTENTMNYAQLREAGILPAPFYKDKTCLLEFSGSDVLRANTMIYCEFDLSVLMGGGSE